MKKITYAKSIYLAILLAMGANAASQYYYSNNRQIPLLVDSTKIMILLDDEWTLNEEEIVGDYERIDSNYSGLGNTTVSGFAL